MTTDSFDGTYAYRVAYCRVRCLRVQGRKHESHVVARGDQRRGRGLSSPQEKRRPTSVEMSKKNRT